MELRPGRVVSIRSSGVIVRLEDGSLTFAKNGLGTRVHPGAPVLIAQENGRETIISRRRS